MSGKKKKEHDEEIDKLMEMMGEVLIIYVNFKQSKSEKVIMVKAFIFTRLK